MPWYNGDYPPSYKNQPIALRKKAVEIANELLGRGVEEGMAIATGLKRARIFYKENPNDMSADKKYLDVFHDHQDFIMKRKQYAQSLHVFHDQTAEYNEVIDTLPVKEMEIRKKEYLQHERDFHEVMYSFDRALDTYKESVGKIKSMNKPVQIVVGKKKYAIRVVKGELEVKDL